MNISPEFQKLIDEKTAVEEELKALNEKLKPYFEKNLHENLVDSQGFPRQDLDFAELSEFNNLKRKYAELNNDHKDLMKKVENELYAFHAQAKKSGQADKELQGLKEKREQEQTAQKKQEQEQKEKLQQEQEKLKQQEEQELKVEDIQPFASISEVTQGSPAFQAGIQVNDLIYNFGGVNHQNHNNLSGLVKKVTDNIGSEILVKVIRKSQDTDDNVNKEDLIEWNNTKIYIKKELKLTPHKWEGNGVLGCRFNPM